MRISAKLLFHIFLYKTSELVFGTLEPFVDICLDFALIPKIF